MTMPGFAAEASLYQTGGHYQTFRRAINSRTKMGDAFYPASKPIRVYGCRPGLIELGEGEEMVCLDPIHIFGGGEHGGTTFGEEMGVGVKGGGGKGGGGGGKGKGKGGGGEPRPRKPPKVSYGCTTKQLQSRTAAPCLDQMQEDVLNGEKNVHYVRCTGTDIMCCQDKAEGKECEALERR
jgi:hypothetical protein